MVSCEHKFVDRKHARVAPHCKLMVCRSRNRWRRQADKPETNVSGSSNKSFR